MAIRQKNRRIRIPDSSADSKHRGFGFRIPILSQHKYSNFKIGKFLLEWQIQQISTTDKHLHEDFGIFNSLI